MSAGGLRGDAPGASGGLVAAAAPEAMLLRPLAPGDDRLIGAIIADAFGDDPVTSWTLGPQPTRDDGAATTAPPPASVASIYAAIARALYLRSGFGEVAGAGEAGSLWLPPDAPKTVGLAASVGIALRILRAGGAGAVRRALAADAALSSWVAEERHYYLFALAVRPDAQGRGFGRALMAAPLARCDAEGAPAYLESSKEENVAFYERFGFQVRGSFRLPDGGPQLWLMRRAPKRRRGG